MGKKLVIGIGTGRCGTVSLSKLLNKCRTVTISHETPKIHDWGFNEEEAQKKLKKLLARRTKIVGDIAFYHLNYVEYYFQNHQDTKCIWIRRNKHDTVTSMYNYTPKLNLWHPDPESEGYILNGYERSMPNFPGNDKRSQIEQYWDLYFKKADELCEKYDILQVNLADLNRSHDRIFDFVGISKRNRKYIDVHENKGFV